METWRHLALVVQRYKFSPLIQVISLISSPNRSTEHSITPLTFIINRYLIPNNLCNPICSYQSYTSTPGLVFLDSLLQQSWWMAFQRPGWGDEVLRTSNDFSYFYRLHEKELAARMHYKARTERLWWLTRVGLKGKCEWQLDNGR